MKTKLFVITMVLILVLMSVANFAVVEEFEGFSTVNLLLNIDGETVSIEGDVPPIIMSGRTMVPIRFISEELGYIVTWDPETRTVLVGETYEQINKPFDDYAVEEEFEGFPTTKVVFNGEPVKGDVPAIIMGSRGMVPVRFISEALGFEVNWNQETRSAIVQAPGLEVVVPEVKEQTSEFYILNESNEKISFNMSDVVAGIAINYGDFIGNKSISGNGFVAGMPAPDEKGAYGVYYYVWDEKLFFVDPGDFISSVVFRDGFVKSGLTDNMTYSALVNLYGNNYEDRSGYNEMEDYDEYSLSYIIKNDKGDIFTLKPMFNEDFKENPQSTIYAIYLIPGKK